MKGPKKEVNNIYKFINLDQKKGGGGRGGFDERRGEVSPQENTKQKPTKLIFSDLAIARDEKKAREGENFLHVLNSENAEKLEFRENVRVGNNKEGGEKKRNFKAR